MNKLSILVFILVIITYVHAVAVDVNKLHIRDEGVANVVTVESTAIFCSFLPPGPQITIADSESNAIAFCSQATVNAPYAKQFPSDPSNSNRSIIRTVYFEQTDNYVQITGTINSDIYVIPSDEGGQYDTRAPVGASCYGYNRFVNLVEPKIDDSGIGLFCIRCCKGSTAKADCPTDKSTYGCQSVIPGNYY